MDYVFRPSQPPDLAAVARELAALDPAVLLDTRDGDVRIATRLEADDVLACLRRAGAPAAPAQLECLPSVCCGGCGG